MRTITANFWEFPGGPVVKDPTLSLLWHRSDPWPRNKIFRELKEKKLSNTLLYPVKISLKGKVKLKRKVKGCTKFKSYRAESSTTKSIQGSHSGRWKCIEWKRGSTKIKKKKKKSTRNGRYAINYKDFSPLIFDLLKT